MTFQEYLIGELQEQTEENSVDFDDESLGYFVEIDYTTQE